MTPIWATGRLEPRAAQAAIRRTASDCAKKERAGFTLVELLMVVAILGLAAGAVVLAVPDPRPAVGAEAERFGARLSRAREEAVLSNRAVAVQVTPTGYAFTAFDGRLWSTLSDGPFGPQRWQAETAVEPEEGVRFVFDPTGVAEPVVLTLTRDGKRRTVSVDGAGEVQIDE